MKKHDGENILGILSKHDGEKIPVSANKHDGEKMPVAADTIVTYRTMSLDGVLSHWHGYIAAGLLNWTSLSQVSSRTREIRCPMTLGRIHDYKIFNILRK